MVIMEQFLAEAFYACTLFKGPFLNDIQCVLIEFQIYTVYQQKVLLKAFNAVGEQELFNNGVRIFDQFPVDFKFFNFS